MGLFSLQRIQVTLEGNTITFVFFEAMCLWYIVHNKTELWKKKHWLHDPFKLKRITADIIRVRGGTEVHITEGTVALQVRQGTFVILIESNEFVIGSYRFETVHLPDLTHAGIKRPLGSLSLCVGLCKWQRALISDMWEVAVLEEGREDKAELYYLHIHPGSPAALTQTHTFWQEDCVSTQFRLMVLWTLCEWREILTGWPERSEVWIEEIWVSDWR